jgi:DNA topoisomerase-1
VSRTLVIVESPAKAKTIGKYLGKDFVVESSVGHIRDLAVPKQLSKEQRKKNVYIDGYAVDVENDFLPIYVVDARKKSTVAELKKILKGSDELLLATDEDREGESIAWHLVEVLKPKVPVKRMVFHEITKKAILEAVGKPREIDQNLVDAQEARRILDRLYGFAMSKMTWRRTKGRSAGRVQSVATRIVVERERERMAFRRASYWDVDGEFAASDAKFPGHLLEIDGKRVVSGKDFGDDGKLKKTTVAHLDETAARKLVQDLGQATFEVARSRRSRPPADPPRPS